MDDFVAARADQPANPDVGPLTAEVRGGSLDVILSSSIRSQIRTDIRVLRKSYQKGQRESIRRGLSANRKKLEAALRHEADILAGKPSCSIPYTAGFPSEAASPRGSAAPGPSRTVTREVGREREGPVDVTAAVLPIAPQVPAYKSWSRLAQNEQAVLTGLKQFYLDETGETVEASDSDAGSERSNTVVEGVLDGPHRGWSEHVLCRIFATHGFSPPVMGYVAKMLHASVHALEARLLKLGVTSCKEGPMPQDGPRGWASGNVDAPIASFYCFRCNLFNCVLHPNEHTPKPERQLPLAAVAASERRPCGASCVWAADKSAPQLDAPPPVAAAVASGRRHLKNRVKRRRTEAGSSDNDDSGSMDASGRCNSEPVTAAAVDHSGRTTPLTAASRSHDETSAVVPDASTAANCVSVATGMSRSIVPAAPTDTAAVAATREGSAAAALEATAAEDRKQQAVAEGLWAGWTDFQKRAVNKGTQIFGWDACAISRLALLPCHRVYAQLKALGAVPAQHSGGIAITISGSRSAGRKTSSRKNNSRVVRMRNQHHPDEPWLAYSPCNCLGKCGTDCSCLKAGNFCERHCSCDRSCGVRFQGCACKSKRNRCSTKSCPCYAADRECDPQLCGVCTATCTSAAAALGPSAAATRKNSGVRATSAIDDSAGGPVDEGACCNMKIRLKQWGRVVMGLSEVAGWGAFLPAPAAKDALLGEYTGELISHAEADRRGKSYDRDNNSYLFSLNSKWVLDARRRGNKMRFANHSRRANCCTRVVMVDGEHRVGIFAKHDLPTGTELLYDYRYDRDTAPAWRTDFEDLGSV